MNLTKYDLLGVSISAVTPKLATEFLEYMIMGTDPQGQSPKGYICIAPVSTIIDAQDSLDYRNIVNQAAMVTPDGAPVAWWGKYTGYDLKRTSGPEWMPYVCDYGQDKGWKHFFYGATEETLAKLQEELTLSFPNINIVGTYAPPFKKEVTLESPEILQKINDSQADIVWVGLGSPKQDIWVHKHRDHLHAPALIAAGAAFDFLAGTKAQAPKWVRRIGMEWFFRLCCEPGRLWKRYLIGNTRFVVLIMKEIMKRMFIREK